MQLPKTEQAKATMITHIDTVISELQSAVAVLHTQHGLWAGNEIAQINQTIGNYASLKSCIRNFK